MTLYIGKKGDYNIPYEKNTVLFCTPNGTYWHEPGHTIGYIVPEALRVDIPEELQNESIEVIKLYCNL